MAALVILDAAEDPAFRAAAGERRLDAAEMLRQASPRFPMRCPIRPFPLPTRNCGRISRARDRLAANFRISEPVIV
jgi:hypothetical protein